MYCPRCGEVSKDSDRFCHSCGLDLSVYRRPASAAGPGPAGAPAEMELSGEPADGWARPGEEPWADYERPRYRPVDQYPTVPHIPSYLGWAIVVLLFCFWPTGIAAVVYASQVNTKLAAGDYAGAQESSRKARMWCWITFGIGVAFVALGLLSLFFLAALTPFVWF